MVYDFMENDLTGPLVLAGDEEGLRHLNFLQGRHPLVIQPQWRRDRVYFSPLKVYEYMAAGRPVVASRVGQLCELIEDRVNGLLFDPGDSEALSEALLSLKRDSGLRVRLGQAARATVLQRHTWAATLRNILDRAGFACTEVLLDDAGVV